MNRLGKRQLAILRALWTRGEATVTDLLQAIETERPLAYSTMATMLSRLEKQGLVTHRVDDRTFVYRAAVSEDRMGRSVVQDLIERLFGGSPSQLVSQLLESDQVDADELRRIRELVNQHAEKRPSRGARRGAR